MIPRLRFFAKFMPCNFFYFINPQHIFVPRAGFDPTHKILLYQPSTSCKISEKTDEWYHKYLKKDWLNNGGNNWRTDKGDYYGPQPVKAGFKNTKHLLDKVETNIQNYHACVIDNGPRQWHNNFNIGLSQNILFLQIRVHPI